MMRMHPIDEDTAPAPVTITRCSVCHSPILPGRIGMCERRRCTGMVERTSMTPRQYAHYIGPSVHPDKGDVTMWYVRPDLRGGNRPVLFVRATLREEDIKSRDDMARIWRNARKGMAHIRHLIVETTAPRGTLQ